MIPPRRPPPSICLVPSIPPAVSRNRWVSRGSEERTVSHGCLMQFFPLPPLPPPRGKRMGESNKWALCFPPMCLYAAPRPGILPSSPPLPPSTEKEEDKPQATIATAAFLHLHPPLPLAPSFSLIRAQREGRVAKSERAQIRPSR